MSEGRQPIFPRSPQNDEQEELLRETRQKLENEESSLSRKTEISCSTCGAINSSQTPFCLECGSILKPVFRMPVSDYKFPQTPISPPVVYGPPLLPFDDENPPPVVYGPPPLLLITNNKILLLGAVLFLILLGAALIVILYFFLTR